MSAGQVSPSPPSTITYLWYNLQDFDEPIAFVIKKLSEPDPSATGRPELQARFDVIRKERRALLADLMQRRRELVLDAIASERKRHAITMHEMEKLLDYCPPGFLEGTECPRSGLIEPLEPPLAPTSEQSGSVPVPTEDEKSESPIEYQTQAAVFNADRRP